MDYAVLKSTFCSSNTTTIPVHPADKPKLHGTSWSVTVAPVQAEVFFDVVLNPGSSKIWSETKPDKGQCRAVWRVKVHKETSDAKFEALKTWNRKWWQWLKKMPQLWQGSEKNLGGFSW